MKSRLLLATVFFLSLAILGTTGVGHAGGLKGIVKFKGHHGPCRVINMVKSNVQEACGKEPWEKDVVVVIGDTPRLKEDTTVIVKFKGKTRTKVVGRTRCIGKKVISLPVLRDCPKGDEFILWLDKDGSGAHMVIETEKAVFKGVDVGDKVIIKTRVKRTVVEGC